MVRQKFASRDCGIFQLTNLDTGKIAIRIDYANTFTLNISADQTYAMKRGRRAIAFSNPMEGTVETEIQVFPFEAISIFGDGTITDGGDRAVLTTIKCTEAGKLTLPDAPNVAGAFVFNKGGVGGTQIEGAVADTVFSATTEADIAVGKSYDVSYYTNDDSIELIKINDNVQVVDYKLEAEILQKSERGKRVPLHITCYKATPQRNIELSFAAEGDPATLKITFDLLEDENEEFVDMYQIKTLAGE